MTRTQLRLTLSLRQMRSLNLIMRQPDTCVSTDTLYNSWPWSVSAEVTKVKDRLKSCFGSKGTQETWQHLLKGHSWDNVWAGIWGLCVKGIWEFFAQLLSKTLYLFIYPGNTQGSRLVITVSTGGHRWALNVHIFVSVKRTHQRASFTRVIYNILIPFLEKCSPPWARRVCQACGFLGEAGASLDLSTLLLMGLSMGLPREGRWGWRLWSALLMGLRSKSQLLDLVTCAFLGHTVPWAAICALLSLEASC